MGKYEWIDMKDAMDIAISLTEKYKDNFGHIDACRLRFIALTDQQQTKDGCKIWNFNSLPDPLNEIFGIDIVVTINFDSWSNLDDKARAIVVASMLSCIDWKERLVSKGYDLRDSKSMIINFGVDYENNPDVPDILNTYYDWRN